MMIADGEVEAIGDPETVSQQYTLANLEAEEIERAFCFPGSTRMRTSGGKRFDSSVARERCVSNGP